MTCFNQINSVDYTVEHTVIREVEHLRLTKKYFLIGEPVKLNFFYVGTVSESNLKVGTIQVSELDIKKFSIHTGTLSGITIITINYLRFIKL